MTSAPLKKTIRHDEHFLDDVLSFCQSHGVEPDWMGNCHVTAFSPAYLPLLRFVREELEQLPFHDEVGRTYLVRDDAENVVKRLSYYLAWQETQVQQQKAWDPDAEAIADIYQGWGEVFKNKIFPDMDRRAICYSLDLLIGPGASPRGIHLVRYLVDARKDCTRFG